MLIKEVARTFCKAKGSPKVSVRTFLSSLHRQQFRLVTLPCALLSGWPRGPGPLNSSSHSLISTFVLSSQCKSQWFPVLVPTNDSHLQRSEYLFTLRYVTLHFRDQRGAALIS